MLIFKKVFGTNFCTLSMGSLNQHLITLKGFAPVTLGAKLSGAVLLCQGFFKDRLNQGQVTNKVGVPETTNEQQNQEQGL